MLLVLLPIPLFYHKTKLFEKHFERAFLITSDLLNLHTSVVRIVPIGHDESYVLLFSYIHGHIILILQVDL